MKYNKIEQPPFICSELPSKIAPEKQWEEGDIDIVIAVEDNH